VSQARPSPRRHSSSSLASSTLGRLPSSGRTGPGKGSTLDGTRTPPDASGSSRAGDGGRTRREGSMPMGRTWDPTVPAIILACGRVAGVVASTGGLEPGGWRAPLAAKRQTVRLEMRLDRRESHIRLTTDVPTGELEGLDATSFSKSGAPVRITW